MRGENTTSHCIKSEEPIEGECSGLIYNIHNSSYVEAESQIPYFILCRICLWCCTLFCFNPNTNYIQRCPCCKNDKLGSSSILSSILSNETNHFDYTPDARNLSEFGLDTSNDNGNNLISGA
jgi:hypothetical protein